MSVKYYGIYLAYAPTVDLRSAGLGRYLAALIKGAEGREDVRFVLACPSWSREGLAELFESEGVSKNSVDICSPTGKPLVLRGYERYQAYKLRPKKISLRQRATNQVYAAKDAFMGRTERRLIRAHSLSGVLPVLLEFALLAVMALLLSPLLVSAALLLGGGVLVQRSAAWALERVAGLRNRLLRALDRPKEDGLVLRLYKQMEEAEANRLLLLINDLSYVRAWYSPTAFWPAFNDISAPKLMCVPDVVLAEFPVGFSDVGGDRFLSTFEALESAIQLGQHFITYSENVKRETLLEGYAVRASNVTVIHHAANDLSRWVKVSGFDDVEATSRHYCGRLLSGALRKSFNRNYAEGFLNDSVRFLFYASQFRPNKNMLLLLRAYKYLLRERLIGHKLILTGNPKDFPVVQQFITENFLENDVLCLYGLNIQELAACYKLADLAVNPSLSEGGCPFTFTEALSVDTPVVMARIPVTEEVLTDPELQDITFFDPYDWQDIAHRIEWALTNREHLLAVQRKTYGELAQRSWTDVVNEHIAVLEQIACDAELSEMPKTI